jgi:hypothetical protein
MSIPNQVIKSLEEMQRESYQQGWKDAVAAMMKAATQDAPAVISAPVARPPPPKTPGKETHREAVVRALHAKPGMTPAQVFAWLKNDGYPASDGAVRTALKRMRKSGTAQKWGDSWNLTEGRPKAW